MPRYIQHPSLATHWVEGALEPVPAAAGPTETVWFALPPDSDTEETWEGLLARPESDDELTIVAVPIYLYDVNFGDRVKVVRSAEGPYVAVGIAQRSGSSTFRALLTSELPNAWHVLSSELAEQGCPGRRHVPKPHSVLLPC